MPEDIRAEPALAITMPDQGSARPTPVRTIDDLASFVVEFKTLQSDNERLQARVAELEAEREELTDDQENQRMVAYEREDFLTKLQEDLKTAVTEADDLSRSMASTVETNKLLRSEIAAWGFEFSLLVKEKDDARSEISGLQAELTNLTATTEVQLDNAEMDKECLSDMLELCKSDAQLAWTQLADLKKQIKKLIGDV